MSDIFSLNADEQRSKLQFAQANLIDPNAPPEVNAFTGTAQAMGEGLMRGGAKAARAIGIAAAAPVSLYERATDSAGKYTDAMFKAVDDIGGNAVDYWTPGPGEVGKAAEVLGGLSEIGLPLMAGGGNPALMIGSQGLNTGADLVKQGVDANVAAGVGTLQAAATGIGFKMPFLGKTLVSRMASGATGNLLVNATPAALSEQALKSRGFDEQAKQFDPTDPTARIVDVLAGAVFGALAHGTAIKPSDVDAVMAANNAKSFQDSTAPGVPVDPASSVLHQEALATTLEQLARGDVVEVADIFGSDDAAFKPDDREAAARTATHEIERQAETSADDLPMDQDIEATAELPALEEPTAVEEPTSAPPTGEAEAPELATLRQLAAESPDVEVHVGFDENGQPIKARVADALAQLSEEHAADLTESKAYEAAINCFLRRG